MIVEALFRIWISVYGPPDKFMSDNGGEFANADFLSLCEQFGIVVKTTAAEAPWSNGIVERNNQTVARSMDKVIADTGCSPDFALLWALNAKNSLQNVAGFSPYQLVLGKNPRIPSLLNDELPAITGTKTSQLIRGTLNAIHAARTAFIASENDEKIRRALKSNIRTTGDVKYVTGDKVFYKRDAVNQWHGPVTVIGQVDQQVFVKHGSFYIRVHPCRLQLKEQASRTITPFPESRIPSVISNNTPSNVPSSPHEVSSISNQLPGSQIPSVVPQSSSLNASFSQEGGGIQTGNEANAQSARTEQAEQRDNVGDTQDVDEAETDRQNTDVDSQDTASLNQSKSPPVKNIKPGVRIKYVEWKGYPENEGIIQSRAGKVTSAKNKDCWTTVNSNGRKGLFSSAKYIIGKSHQEVLTILRQKPMKCPSKMVETKQ